MPMEIIGLLLVQNVSIEFVHKITQRIASASVLAIFCLWITPDFQESDFLVPRSNIVIPVLPSSW